MQNYEDLFGMGSVVDPYPLLDGNPVSAKDALKDVGYYGDADVSNKMGVSTFIGLALEVASIGANLWMNYSNNRRNDERAEEAYQRSVAMWNKQTDYNSPANQIARLKQAGLNPNLLYGSPQNTASSAPEKKPASGSPGRVDPLSAMNALMLGKQMQSIDSQIKVQDAEARNIDASTAGIELDNKKKTFDNSKQVQNYERNVREQEANISFINKRVDEISSLIDLNKQLRYESFMRESKLKIERDFLKETKEYDKMFKVLGIFSTLSEIEKSKALVADFYSQISYRKKKGEKIDAEIITEALKQSKLVSDIKLQDIESIIKMASSNYNVGLLYKKMLEGTATPEEVDEFKLKYLQDYLSGFTGMGVLGKLTSLILLGSFM